MLTQRQRTLLKHAGYRELLTLWRFEPSESPWFSNDILTTAFHQAFGRERNKLSISDQMKISQEIGFSGGVQRGAYDQHTERQ